MASFDFAEKRLARAFQRSGSAFAMYLCKRSIALLAVLHSQNNYKN